jgi:hypothetical protein
MKRTGRFFFYLIMVLQVLLSSGVSANPVIHHATIVYFEQNGTSVDDEIRYSLDCTGHTCREWDCSSPDDQKPPAEYVQSSRIRDSGICPPSNGCIISEDRETARHVNFHLDFCSVNGEIDGKKFVIDNYSDTRYDCFLKGFRDGDGNFYTDYCEIHIGLPADLTVQLQPGELNQSPRSSHSPPRSPIKKLHQGFIQDVYCTLLSFFGARC